MVAPGAARGSIYAYTTTGGEELKRVARECAMPDALVVVDLDRMATKEMPFQWKKGRRLSFDVRVRPVKRISKDGYFRAGAEVDAYLAEAQQRHPEGPSKADPIIREDVYRRWLHERFGDSAKVDAAKMVTCERRKSHLGAKSSEGPDVVWHGDLTVQDGEVFAAKLASGVGRHSAFGYGMLLLRPAA
jgi:CRISPR system Cascade subunit CasE